MADNRNGNSSALTIGGFGLRFVIALVLVLATFNPSGYSAWHTVSEAVSASEFGPMHLILVAVLLIGWVIYWIATWRALGTLGVALAGLLLGAIIWLLFDIGLLKAESVSAASWILLVALAVVLAVGVSWSHLWRRITGQINVEDVDE